MEDEGYIKRHPLLKWTNMDEFQKAMSLDDKAPVVVVLAAMGFKIFDEQCEIDVIEGSIARVESIHRDGDVLAHVEGEFSEPIRVVAGEGGCTLSIIYHNQQEWD